MIEEGMKVRVREDLFLADEDLHGAQSLLASAGDEGVVYRINHHCGPYPIMVQIGEDRDNIVNFTEDELEVIA